ncbi:MAG: hypothetical protein Q8N13_22370 [Acidovorax sp.]|nr:hypothetical protein [Acidovorax sp.]
MALFSGSSALLNDINRAPKSHLVAAPLVFTFNKVVVETLTLALDRPDQIGLSVQSHLPMFAIGTTIPQFPPGEPIAFAMTLRNSREDVFESQFMSFNLNFDNGIES